MGKVYCIKCGSNSLFFCRGLSQTMVKEGDKLYVYFCSECMEFMTIWRIESGNPNLKAATRVTMIKPLGRKAQRATEIELKGAVRFGN